MPGPAPPEPAAAQRTDEEDRFSSAPAVWLPRMVVKEHRKKATIIWVSLLIGFFAYVGYIIWEVIKSRMDPASSIELKKEYYTFPDVAVCSAYGQGCLYSGCFEILVLSAVVSQTGFLDDTTNFTDDHAYANEEFHAMYTDCVLVPLSKLSVNETGINDGSITSFSVSFALTWFEGDMEDYFDSSTSAFNNQFVDLYFVAEESSLESFEGQSVDARVPYSRVTPMANTVFEATKNNMVMEVTEFTAINAEGEEQESQRSFSQTTIPSTTHWLWGGIDSEFELAVLLVDMSIRKFEYTAIQEVDPVDGWSIIGAIGGIWQFVVTGFWLFFVFSEKQSPDRKMRNFRKSINKPVEVIRRLSSVSSRRSSNQDVVIDASEEDLPVDWVKIRGADGSIYYSNVNTGTRQTAPPHQLQDGTGGAALPPSYSALNRIFQPAHNSSAQASASGVPRGAAERSSERRTSLNADPLPPGWVERRDGNGRPYYMDTNNKTTQWERPIQRVHTIGGSDRRPQVVDTPMSHTRRVSGASSAHSHETSSMTTSTAAAAAAGGAGGAEVHVSAALPPNWSKCTTANNKTYYSNSVTKKTQWEFPIG